MYKNEEYIVDIIDNGYEGEGIAKVNNFTVFIPGAIKGEKVKILIVKVNTSHAFGKIIEILSASEKRNNKVGLLTRIDADLRENFRIKTIRDGTTMAEVIEQYIKKYLTEN